LDSDEAARIATFSGYDRTLQIVDEVENACRLHATVTPGTSCTAVRLTFLPSTTRGCSGQLYFSFDEDMKPKRM
jgi:hypothetical protein